MVRETRHLWVGNLPENVSKERIKEYFNRYGPVQSVKPLPGKDGAGEAASAVTVAFMDIKSACKALQTPHKLDERVLKTDFYDPASGACGSGSCPPAPEEKGGGPGGGGPPGGLKGSGEVARPVGGGGHWRHGGHQDNQGGRDYQNRNNHQARYPDPDQFRHRSRMPYRNGNFGQDGVRGNAAYRNNYGWKDSRGREGQYGVPPDKQETRLLPGNKAPVNSNPTSTSAVNTTNAGSGKKKQRARKSKSSESGSDSQQSGSNSRSSSSSSSRSSSSASGSSKSPSPDRRASKRTGGGMQGGNFLPHTEFDKQCTVVVRNLPERPTEAAVKEELNREYKKGGCVVREVRVVDKKREGGVTRTAIITFSDPADVSKALEDSRNKRILGSLIDVEKLNSHSGDDRTSREGEYSEFHNRATRTLFVGNISREVVPSEIHDRFKEFGEILEIDIKKPDYALVQFVDIKSVVKAMRGMSSEMIAGQRVRLGFGLSVATKCVWCDGVGAEVTEKMLQVEFSQYGKIQDLIVDRSRGHALVYFDQLKKATIAVKEMRGRSIMGCRLQTDYASHECRAAFFDHCKKSGMDIRERAKPWEQDQNQGDKRERVERKPRERSTESRGSGAGGGRGRKRDEYDEELRRFQSERGKFDETERCFTPPYGGARRSVPSTGGPSRSPSPLPRSTRSPGQQSRSGHDRTAFSDRESVVSDSSRHGSPVSRDGWRGSRYKPRVQAISPPGDSRSPADHDDSRRGSKRYREEERRSGGRPQDPRVSDHVTAEKKHFKPGGVDSGLSEETSSGSSGSVPDVDNAKLPGARGPNSVKQPPNRRTSTDSASASMDGSSRPATPSMTLPFSSGGPSLLRVAATEEGYTAPRTPVSPPPSSDGSRPGTPLCDENPENLMSRSAAAPVRLASHLRTQTNSSEPMSLPLPRFAHVLSTSPGDRPRPQISPRDSREAGAPPTQPGLLKHSTTRPDLAKLSILSPTKFPNGPPEPPRARDPRLKSPAGEPSPAPTPSLKSPVSVPGGTKLATFLSPGSSTPTTPVQPSPGHKPKDPRNPACGLLAVAIPTVVAASPLSPLPRPARNNHEGAESLPAAVAPDNKPAAEAGPLELEERLKLLDEKYQSWSSLTRVSGSGPGREAGGGRFNLDIKPAQPSAIVQKLLSRKSVFDEDSKRLENINEKYDASEEENGESGTGAPPPAAGYNTISTLPLKPSMQEHSPSSDSPIASTEPIASTMIVRDLPIVPQMLPSSPVKVAALHRPSMSPRMYLPQVQSPKTLDESSRPLPLPYRAGTPATMGSNPIKPLVDKLSKPAAFTKPSATVTPTLKSTGLTASTSVRSNVFTTTSTKTVSTCTMAPGNISQPHIGVEKGEASSTTCSPKPDSVLTEVTSSPTLQPPPQETDSDPNVTSTTGTEQKKKQEANRDIRTMKKELDSLTSLKEKRDLGEELLFAPSATIMQAKTKYEKSEKKKPSSSSAQDILKDVKRAKESLHKDKIKSNREKKDKMKVKQKNDLKDFLSATATIRKEAKKEEARKDEKRDQQPDVKKQESKTEDKPLQKRRLSSNSEVEEAEPKSKIPKLKVEGEGEPELKKLKSEPMTPMGRIPKLAKKEPERKETTATARSSDGSKDRSKLSYSKSDSKPKSRHDDRHGHRLSSSGDKVEDRKRDKHKKKKKEKDKEREKEDKLKKQDKSKSRSHSTDDERHHKKLKKSKDSKKKDDKERLNSKGDKKDKVKREEKEKERAREKNMSKEEREKEKAKRRHKEMVEEQRKMFEQLRKKKKMENGNGDSDGDDSSGDEANFSIFDEPVFDENNPIYFSMYDKVKARRSCVKAKEEEEARRQEEALNKFAKLKAQRAKREGKKKSVDSDDDSMDDDEIGQPRISSPLNSEDGNGGSLNKKNSSLLNSSSDSEGDLNGQVKRESKLKSGNGSNDERKRSFKPKPRALDSSDEESPSGSRKPRSKLHPGLDSSESEEMVEDEKKAESKPPRKLPIYSDSESENDSFKNSHSKHSGSESEVTDSKASALAVLAMSKKKLDIKQEVKNEPVSSDCETEPTDPIVSGPEDIANLKKEIKTEEGVEPKIHKKKAHHVKKEKKRDRESKEVGKEKSLLGQKLKMAKIFGTSSEDEGNSRNSKPPTPNTSGGKATAAKSMPKGPSKSHITRVEKVNFSDNSDAEKRLDSPALMSDSDDDVPSRPPTPTFLAAKAGAKLQEQSKAKEPVKVKEAVKNEEVQINKDGVKSTRTNESSEDEMLPQEAKFETKKELERNRRLSAHDRQKESENLFDSLLTVNVDLPAKPTSWKSPGGSLKSPNMKSPNKVSPGSARTPNSGSPGTQRSPLVSPGGKPTYLLAHMFGGGDRSAREAEKIHRAQEREMHKKGSDRITKESFKTKKDLDDASSTKQQGEVRSENTPGEKTEVKETEKSLVETKEKEPVQDTEMSKKKSEAKKEKTSSSSVSPKEVEIEKEVKAKLFDPMKAKEEGRSKEKKTRAAEDGFVERKSVRDRSKEEKKLLEANESKGKTGGARTSATGKEKDEDHQVRTTKKLEGGLGQTRPEIAETQTKLAKVEATNAHSRGIFTKEVPCTKDSVFDFKDEVEVVGTLKPTSCLESSKSKYSKGPEKSSPVVVEVPTTPPTSPTATLPSSSSYASFAASTKIEATSSPGPASEDDDTPLLIIADDSEVTEVTPDDEEVTEVKQIVDEKKVRASTANEVENIENTLAPAKSAPSSNARQLKSSESSEQEQLEKSIASITGDARRDTVDSMDTETAALTTTVEQKRTVISQEETENAINALLGESFESFEPEPEPVEPEPAAARVAESIEPTGDDEAAAAVAGLADDEAASAVLGLAEANDWHSSVSKQQEDESIENIAAEIRRSSTESSRRFSTESSKSGEESNRTEEKTALKMPETKKGAEEEQILKPIKSQGEETSGNMETTATSKSKDSGDKGKKEAEDVFDFKVDEFTTEPLKVIDRPKQAAPSTSDPVAAQEKNSSQDTPVVPARVGTARDSSRLKAQPIQNSQVVQQPHQIHTTASSPVSAPVTSPLSAVGRESPLVLQRLSTEEKSSPPLPLASPSLPLASPNSGKSPKPRTRRSTGGKSRESEEESPDTLQKINLILEQAKQEAERSQAHQSQTQHHLVPLPTAFRTAEGGALLAAQAAAPVQDLLIDPKTGQVVGRQSAPNSVTLTLVTSTGQDQPATNQHAADLRVAVAPPRTGVPQPTVLPPRHDQQVRPAGGPGPRVVAAAPRPPRPPLPIQLPTQPLPPESVRKAQPVLLEQNQPSKLVQSRQTPLPVSLPTEPVPRSVAAASQMPNLPRTPLPFSSAAMVSSSNGAALRLVTTQPMISRAQPPSGWQPSTGPRPQSSIQETGQRVSLNKRDKDPELETKPATDAGNGAGQPGPLKLRGDYLQPRDRVERPSSTPLSSPAPMVASQHQYEVPAAHLASSAAQYEAELVRLASYRDLTLIYQQLLSQGHPEHVAQNMAQSILRERYDTYRHEEARPGSVPPTMALHHMEEQMRRQQMPQSVRQPLPAHTSQVEAYRQTESPHQAVYMGAHPAYQAHSSHLESYRRPGLGPEPPAAHSGQPVARLTQSPAVSDYSISRPSSPTYNPSVSDYRLPHLAAYPICWSGTLGLKNDMANVRMHYVSGNRDLAKASLPDTGSTLKIVQRMRLEDSQLDGVAKKMETKSEHCMLLALPNGSEHEEIEHQSKILRSNFITYLQLKSAAGIVNVSNEDNQPAYIVHVFPSCDFANENLARIAPNLLHRVADIEHLVIVIATVFDVNR